MESAVPILRRNDPERTRIKIWLALEDDDDALASALENAQFIRTVIVVFYASDSNFLLWRALLRVLSTSTRLQRVSFFDAQQPNDLRPFAEIQPFLEAASVNNEITRVDLWNLRLNGSVAGALIKAMTSLTHLTLCDVQIGPVNGSSNPGTIAMAEALRVNQNIQFFQFSPSLNNIDMLPIVQQLASNRQLRAIRLDLAGASAENRENVSAYLQAAAKFQSLRQLALTGINSETGFNAVLQILPSLLVGLVKLHFVEFDFAEHTNRGPQLLQALKRNYKLCEVQAFSKINGNETPIFAPGSGGSEQLTRYSVRNGRLAEWVKNPKSVPRQLWPEALKLAQEAGEATLWQSLLKVAPEVADQVRNKRKRKRT